MIIAKKIKHDVPGPHRFFNLRGCKKNYNYVGTYKYIFKLILIVFLS